MSHAVRTAPTGPKRRVSFTRATPPFCLLAVAGAAALVAVLLVGVMVAVPPVAFVAVSLAVPVAVAVVGVIGGRGCERICENPGRLRGGGLLRWHRGRRRCRCGWRWRSGGGGCRLRWPEMRPHCVPGRCRPGHGCDDRVPDRRTRHVYCRRHDDPRELWRRRWRHGCGVHRGGGTAEHAALPRRSDSHRRGFHGRRCCEMGQYQRRSDVHRLDQTPGQDQEPADHRKRQRPRGQLCRCSPHGFPPFCRQPLERHRHPVPGP